jgi:transposase
MTVKDVKAYVKRHKNDAVRTQVINALRAHLAELGIVAAQGREGLKDLLAIIADEKDERLPVDAREPNRPCGAASGVADADRIDREADYRATPCE